MTSYSEGRLIPQKVTRSPREPGSQECETLRYSTRTSPAGALRPSTAGCRSFRQGYLQGDLLFAGRSRLASRTGMHTPEEIEFTVGDCVRVRMRTPSRAAFASALRPDIRDAACGFSAVQLQDREGEPAHEGYDILRTVCRARKIVKALETGQGVENVDHFIPRARGRFVVPLREPVDDGP